MEPIDWLVDKILPVGLSILGAPSKYYKSYMALFGLVSLCNEAYVAVFHNRMQK